MQVIDNTPTIKRLTVTALPKGAVFRTVSDSIWMVVQGRQAVCLAAGRPAARCDEGDVRSIDGAYYLFSKIQVLEAVLHVQAN